MSNKTKYIAHTGISYPLQSGPGEGRAETGDELPVYVIKRAPWLVEQGHVSEHTVLAATDAPESDGA